MEVIKEKGFRITELDPMRLEIHELAGANPMMPQDQYYEFVKQFENGFDKNISHVVMYKGKVVDGRHRTRACKELGIKLWARNLPGTMSLTEVEEFVEGTENRRHQTATQRAIGAYKYYLSRQLEGRPVSQEYAATKKLSSRKYLARAKQLADLIGTELIDRLHNGEKLKVINAKTGLPTQTDALLTLVNYFTQRNGELVVETKVNSTLTDAESILAREKVAELQLECSLLVLEEIQHILHQTLKGSKVHRLNGVEEEDVMSSTFA